MFPELVRLSPARRNAGAQGAGGAFHAEGIAFDAGPGTLINAGRERILPTAPNRWNFEAPAAPERSACKDSPYSAQSGSGVSRQGGSSILWLNNGGQRHLYFRALSQPASDLQAPLVGLEDRPADR